jgi:hypothetical protein
LRRRQVGAGMPLDAQIEFEQQDLLAEPIRRDQRELARNRRCPFAGA